MFRKRLRSGRSEVSSHGSRECDADVDTGVASTHTDSPHMVIQTRESTRGVREAPTAVDDDAHAHAPLSHAAKRKLEAQASRRKQRRLAGGGDTTSGEEDRDDADETNDRNQSSAARSKRRRTTEPLARPPAPAGGRRTRSASRRERESHRQRRRRSRDASSEEDDDDDDDDDDVVDEDEVEVDQDQDVHMSEATVTPPALLVAQPATSTDDGISSSSPTARRISPRLSELMCVESMEEATGDAGATAAAGSTHASLPVNASAFMKPSSTPASPAGEVAVRTPQLPLDECADASLASEASPALSALAASPHICSAYCGHTTTAVAEASLADSHLLAPLAHTTGSSRTSSASRVTTRSRHRASLGVAALPSPAAESQAPSIASAAHHHANLPLQSSPASCAGASIASARPSRRAPRMSAPAVGGVTWCNGVAMACPPSAESESAPRSAVSSRSTRARTRRESHRTELLAHHMPTPRSAVTISDESSMAMRVAVVDAEGDSHLAEEEEHDESEYDSSLRGPLLVSTPAIKAANARYEWDTDPDEGDDDEEEKSEVHAAHDGDTPSSSSHADSLSMSHQEEQPADDDDDEDDESWGEESSESASSSCEEEEKEEEAEVEQAPHHASSSGEEDQEESGVPLDSDDQMPLADLIAASSRAKRSSSSAAPPDATTSQEDAAARPRPHGFGFGARVRSRQVTTTTAATSSELSERSGSVVSGSTVAVAPLVPRAPSKPARKHVAPATANLPYDAPFPRSPLPVLLSHSPRHDPSPYPSHLLAEEDAQRRADASSSSAAAGASTSSTGVDPYSVLDPSLPLESLFARARTIPYNFSSVHACSKGWAFASWSRRDALENRARRDSEHARRLRDEAELVQLQVRTRLEAEFGLPPMDDDANLRVLDDAHREKRAELHSSDDDSDVPPSLPADGWEKTFGDMLAESIPTVTVDPHVTAAAAAAGTPLGPNSSQVLAPPSSNGPAFFAREWRSEVPASLRAVEAVYARHGMRRGAVPLALLDDIATPASVGMRARKYQRAESQTHVRPTRSALLRRQASLQQIAAENEQTHGNNRSSPLAGIASRDLARILGCLDLASLLAARASCRAVRAVAADASFKSQVWRRHMFLFTNMTSLTGWIRRPRNYLDQRGAIVPDEEEALEGEEGESGLLTQPFAEGEVWFRSTRSERDLAPSTLHGGTSRWRRVHDGFTQASAPFAYHVRLEEDVLLCPSLWSRLHSYRSTLHTLEIVNNLTLLSDALLGVMLEGLERAPASSRTAALSAARAAGEDACDAYAWYPVWCWPFSSSVRAALPSLTALTLYNCINFDMESGLQFLPFYRGQLRSLVLDKCRGVGGGSAEHSEFHLAQSEATNLLGSCHQLRRLRLSGCRELHPTHVRMLYPLSYLEELDLSWCTIVDDACLISLFGGVTNDHASGRWSHASAASGVVASTAAAPSGIQLSLKRLALQGCVGVTDRAVIDGISRLRGLETLDLSQLGSNLSNRGVASLVALPRLSRLLLRFDGGVTDGVAPALASMSSLNYLDVNFCTGITVHGKIAMKNRKKGMPLFFLTV